jgi:hypothetical protein
VLPLALGEAYESGVGVLAAVKRGELFEVRLPRYCSCSGGSWRRCEIMVSAGSEPEKLVPKITLRGPKAAA